MQACYQANERDADRLARRWGSQTEIARLPVERLEKVNPILDRRAPSIMSPGRGRCLSLGGYVTGTGATSGVPAAGGR
jgi:hypothetical protein